jgi:hypothetical protein
MVVKGARATHLAGVLQAGMVDGNSARRWLSLRKPMRDADIDALIHKDHTG